MEAKAKKLKEAKEHTGDIPRIIKMESSKFEKPLAETSPKLLLARKKLATTRSKKNLQGLPEAVPEGTVPVKTTDATLTLKMPGQKDTVLNKSDVANFGTPEQRNIPLIFFAARKTVKNHHKKFEELMRNHGKAQLNKIMGICTIRKRDTQPGTLTRDPTWRKYWGPRSHLSGDISTPPKRANRARNDLLKAPRNHSPPKISRRTIVLLILQRSSKSTRQICRPAEVREYEPEPRRTVQTPMTSKTRYQRTNPNRPWKILGYSELPSATGRTSSTHHCRPPGGVHNATRWRRTCTHKRQPHYSGLIGKRLWGANTIERLRKRAQSRRTLTRAHEHKLP